MAFPATQALAPKAISPAAAALPCSAGHQLTHDKAPGASPCSPPGRPAPCPPFATRAPDHLAASRPVPADFLNLDRRFTQYACECMGERSGRACRPHGAAAPWPHLWPAPLPPPAGANVTNELRLGAATHLVVKELGTLSPKLKAAQHQLLYDALAVATGLRPAAMLDYVRMTQQQLRGLVQALAQAGVSQGAGLRLPADADAS